jgi:hypothetical protein
MVFGYEPPSAKNGLGVGYPGGRHDDDSPRIPARIQESVFCWSNLRKRPRPEDGGPSPGRTRQRKSSMPSRARDAASLDASQKLRPRFRFSGRRGGWRTVTLVLVGNMDCFIRRDRTHDVRLKGIFIDRLWR